MPGDLNASRIKMNVADLDRCHRCFLQPTQSIYVGIFYPPGASQMVGRWPMLVPSGRGAGEKLLLASHNCAFVYDSNIDRYIETNAGSL